MIASSSSRCLRVFREDVHGYLVAMRRLRILDDHAYDFLVAMSVGDALSSLVYPGMPGRLLLNSCIFRCIAHCALPELRFSLHSPLRAACSSRVCCLRPEELFLCMA